MALPLLGGHLRVCSRAASRWAPLVRPTPARVDVRRSWLSTTASDGGDEELNPETVSYLVDRASAREVYLVGTAHVSEKSAEDVRHTVRIAKPDTIMVELCAQREQRIREGKGPRGPKELLNELLRGGSQQGFGGQFLLKVGFASIYALLQQYGMVPGLEFKAALDEADRGKLSLVLGDLPIDTTMQRLWAELSTMDKMRLMRAPPPPPELAERANELSAMKILGSVEEMKNRRQIAMLRGYMAGWLPEVMDVMVEQRDQCMTEALWNKCKIGRTVAVVGMAHMDGIEDEWRKRGGEVFLHGANSLKTSK